MEKILLFLNENVAIINLIWVITLVSMVVLYVLCNILPNRIIGKLLPLHIVFKPKTNFDLDFQSIGYALLHTKWINRITHYTIFLDAILWFVIFQFWHWSIAPTILAAILLQAILIGDKKFGVSFLIMGGLAFLGGALIIQYAGMQNAVLISKVVLMTGALLRMISHSFELMPPLVLSKTDQFVPLNHRTINWKIPVLTFVGYVAEFSSALPNRLFPVQINYLHQKMLGIKPITNMPWSEIKTKSQNVLKGGYSKLKILNIYYSSVTNLK